MLQRETIQPRSLRRHAPRLLLAAAAGGALVAAMFQLGVRAATVPVAHVHVVRSHAPAAVPAVAPVRVAPGSDARAATTACAPADSAATVSRATVDGWLADGESIARSARVVPAMLHGVPAGFKVYAIRPGSPAAVIGLENGDTIARVNGRDVTSVERLLDALEGWSERSRADISLTRRGCPVTLTVSLV